MTADYHREFYTQCFTLQCESLAMINTKPSQSWLLLTDSLVAWVVIVTQSN